VRALQFNRNVSQRPTSQPNQAPTPIGCPVFKELANQHVALDLPFRLISEAAHCTGFISCVNPFQKTFERSDLAAQANAK
jgi:hypothetical protein